MRRMVITALALATLAATALGAVQVTTLDAHVVCIPPAVIQAWS